MATVRVLSLLKTLAHPAWAQEGGAGRWLPLPAGSRRAGLAADRQLCPAMCRTAHGAGHFCLLYLHTYCTVHPSAGTWRGRGNGILREPGLHSKSRHPRHSRRPSYRRAGSVWLCLLAPQGTPHPPPPPRLPAAAAGVDDEEQRAVGRRAYPPATGGGAAVSMPNWRRASPPCSRGSKAARRLLPVVGPADAVMVRRGYEGNAPLSSRAGADINDSVVDS